MKKKQVNKEVWVLAWGGCFLFVFFLFGFLFCLFVFGCLLLLLFWIGFSCYSPGPCVANSLLQLILDADKLGLCFPFSF